MNLPAWAMNVLSLLIGVGILGVGGEMLVRGATRLAKSLGVSTLVIGLTVVAFGTSAPEAAVTVFAAMNDVTDLAVGNVVGSNIANILLILGLAALVQPMRVSRNLLRIDGPVMLLAVLALYVIALVNQRIDRIAGAFLVAGLFTYTLTTYYASRGLRPHTAEIEETSTGLAQRWWWNGPLVIAGIAGLVYGAQLMVQGASGLATSFGISQHIIGLTIVAIGTSLPELATVIIAARHKQPDIAIGNVVGSNIFNVLFVTGAASLANPLPVPAAVIHFDAPLMVLACVVFYPMALFGRNVNRWEGALLLGGYIAYIAWLTIQAT